MKTILTAASLAAMATCTPMIASAQTAAAGTSPIYGTLGYSQSRSQGVDLGSIQGRVGARLHQNFGVEGELGMSVDNDHTYIGGTRVRAKEKHQAGIYGVGFLPINEKIDLLARAGYGNQKIKYSGPTGSASDNRDSWNFGAGAQYHLDGVNGIRADYTRKEFRDSKASANVWSVAYTRRF